MKRPLRRLKANEGPGKPNSFFYIYLLIIPSLYFKDLLEGIVLYYSLAVIVISGMIVSRVYPNCLTVEEFLSPLSKKEKKHYLIRQYQIKTWGHIVAYDIVLMLFVYLERLSIEGAILLGIQFILWSVISHLYIDTTECEKVEKDSEIRLQGYMIWQNVFQIISIVWWLLVLLSVIENDFYSKTDYILALIWLGIQGLLALKIVKRYAKALFEVGANYELMYVEGKDKKEYRK